MIEKTPLLRERVRKITGSFAFIEHRFLRDGFLQGLCHHELILYYFLLLVADTNGLSYYGYHKICTLLQLSLDDYILARDALIEKDLIAFDGRLFQVLSLPEQPLAKPSKPLKTKEHMAQNDPATIQQMIRQSLSTGGTSP